LDLLQPPSPPLLLFHKPIGQLPPEICRVFHLGMYATFTFGIILWIIYGILIGSGPILVANIHHICFISNYFVFKNSAPDGTPPR